MSASTAYTPLESLLLFQALRAEGVNSHAVFNRISEQLKKIGFVREDPTYDSGRLSPDALRELYLWLLKEEVKRDLERQFENDDVLQNGSLDASKRKRKVASPVLPTVHEASQHAHLIPQLVTRLYARYRENAVRDIREQERKYHAVKKEIEDIEQGKWDERLQRQRTASGTQSPHLSTSAQLQDAARSTRQSPASAADGGENGKASTSTKPTRSNKINDVMNHGPDPANDLEHHRRTSSGNILPPLSEMAPQSPRFGIPPKVPGSLSTQIPNQGYGYSPTSGHQSPYASHHGHPVGNPLGSPQVQQSLSRPSSSPRPILPPPPGMKLPPPSPVQHSASPNAYGPPLSGQPPYPQAPHHRLPNTQSPTADRPPRGYPPNTTHHVPQPPQQGYYQAPPYLDRRTSYPPPQPQPTYQMQGARAGGYQLQPFPVDPNQQVHQRYGQAPQQIPTDAQRSPHYPPYPSSAPTTVQRPGPPDRRMSEIIAKLGTPVSTPRTTPPRSNRNRNFKRLTDLQTGTPIPSPVTEVEPLSPLLKRSEPAGRSGRSTRKRGNVESGNSAEPEVETMTRSTRARGRAKRELSPHSVVSSTADESRITRSHSVSTAAGALPTSDDRPASRGKVKVEPSTPAGFVEIPEAEGASGGRMTRKRRGHSADSPSTTTIQAQSSALSGNLCCRRRRLGDSTTASYHCHCDPQLPQDVRHNHQRHQQPQTRLLLRQPSPRQGCTWL